jgi:hypothetical protein
MIGCSGSQVYQISPIFQIFKKRNILFIYLNLWLHDLKILNHNTVFGRLFGVMRLFFYKTLDSIFRDQVILFPWLKEIILPSYDALVQLFLIRRATLRIDLLFFYRIIIWYQNIFLFFNRLILLFNAQNFFFFLNNKIVAIINLYGIFQIAPQNRLYGQFTVLWSADAALSGLAMISELNSSFCLIFRFPFSFIFKL